MVVAVVAGFARTGAARARAGRRRSASGSRRRRRARPRRPRSADLTGQWVAQVTEDWRWRMITPPKGDYASVPLNAAGPAGGRRLGSRDGRAAGEACRAFGAGGIMRLADAPARSRGRTTTRSRSRRTRASRPDCSISSARRRPKRRRAGRAAPSPNGWAARRRPVLRSRGADARSSDGRARVRPRPGAPPPALAAAAARGAARPASAPPAGAFKVTTTDLKPGYLRKNGVPYSGQAVVTEYYDRCSMFGNDYLQVVTVVTDPTYLHDAVRRQQSVQASSATNRSGIRRRARPTAPLGTFRAAAVLCHDEHETRVNAYLPPA